MDWLDRTRSADASSSSRPIIFVLLEPMMTNGTILHKRRVFYSTLYKESVILKEYLSLGDLDTIVSAKLN